MNAQLFFRRNSSTILTCVAAIGVVCTAIATIKETPKALEKIEEAEKEKGEELTKVEKIVVATPSYIPAILIGAGTIACIFGSNVLSRQQQASLMSAYALVDNSYKEYKNKLKELYGEETHQNIVDAIAAEKSKDIVVRANGMVGSYDLALDKACGEPVLFYYEFGGKFFESTIEQVITAEYHLNRNFVLRGYSVLNELYEFLGLEPTDYGSEVGWAIEDEFYWIDFDHRKTVLDNGLECYIIETPYGPSTDFQEYYYY